MERDLAKVTQQQRFISEADVLQFVTLAHIRFCFPLTELAQKQSFSTMWSVCWSKNHNTEKTKK